MFKNNSEKCGRKQKLKALSQKKNLFIEHVLKCETKPKFSNDYAGSLAKFVYNLEEWIKTSKNKEDIKIFKRLLKEIKLQSKKQIKETITVQPEVKQEKLVKKNNIEKKEKIEKTPFTINTYKKDYSRLVYWVNPFLPVNVGKLGTTQGWKIEKKDREYY